MVMESNWFKALITAVLRADHCIKQPGSVVG